MNQFTIILLRRITYKTTQLRSYDFLNFRENLIFSLLVKPDFSLFFGTVISLFLLSVSISVDVLIVLCERRFQYVVNISRYY